ncbi:MAG: hypothetical protein ACI9PY_000777 [Ascidiaceihabitans sp.]|jgi:hypothetical protein
MVERVDRRVLGSVRLMDGASGVPIARRLEIQARGLVLTFTRSGLYVIMRADGLDAHVTTFDAPPPVPANQSLPFTLTITDRQNQFMPRTAVIDLPRSFDPTAGVIDLQTPIDITLASGAARPANPGWAVVEMRIRDTADFHVRGALIEVFPQGGGPRMAWGIANHHGEARLPIMGLRPYREVENDPADPDDNEIVTRETPVEVRATADPAAIWPADPDRLAGPDPTFRRATLPLLALTPGRTDSATLVLDLS